MPYLKDDVLDEDTNLVGVKIGSVNEVHLYSKYPERLENHHYIDRIELFVHDLQREFNYYPHLVDENNPITPSDIQREIMNIKRIHPKVFYYEE